MKILKKGNYLHAITTEDNERGTTVKKGSHMATYSITTGKFTGATAFFTPELLERAKEFEL